MNPHPTPEELLAFLQGEARKEQGLAINRHLRDCQDCEREAGKLQEAAALVAFAAEGQASAAHPVIGKVAAAAGLAAAVIVASWLLWFRPGGPRFLERVADEWRIATGAPGPASLVLAVDRPVQVPTPTGGTLNLQPGSLVLSTRAGPVLLRGRAQGSGPARLVTPGWVIEGDGTFQVNVNAGHLKPLYTLLVPGQVAKLGALADPDELRMELDLRAQGEPYAILLTCLEGQVEGRAGKRKRSVAPGQRESLETPAAASAAPAPPPRLCFPKGATSGLVRPALLAALRGSGPDEHDAALTLGVELGLVEVVEAAAARVGLGLGPSAGRPALQALRRWSPELTFRAVEAAGPKDSRPPGVEASLVLKEEVQALMPESPPDRVEKALQLRMSLEPAERMEGLFELVRLGHEPSFRLLVQEIASEEDAFLVRALEGTLREAPEAMQLRLLGRIAGDLGRHLGLAPLAPTLEELLKRRSPEVAAAAGEALAVLGLSGSAVAYANWLAEQTPGSPGFSRALTGMGRFPGPAAASAFVRELARIQEAGRRRDLVADWSARDGEALRALETFAAAETVPGVRAAALARLIARGAGTKAVLEALLPTLAPEDLQAATRAFRDAPGRVPPALLRTALESAGAGARLGGVELVRLGEPGVAPDAGTLHRLTRMVETRIREGRGTSDAESAARTALEVLARARADGVAGWCELLQGDPDPAWTETVALARVLTGDERGPPKLAEVIATLEGQARILDALDRLGRPVPLTVVPVAGTISLDARASIPSRVLSQQLLFRPRAGGQPGGPVPPQDLVPWVTLEHAVLQFGRNRREGLPLLDEALQSIPALWPDWCQVRLLDEARTRGLLVSDLTELWDRLDREPRALDVIAAGLASLLPEFLRAGAPEVHEKRAPWLQAPGETVPAPAREGLERVEELRRRCQDAFAEAGLHWAARPGGERAFRLAVRGLCRFQDGLTEPRLRSLRAGTTHSRNFVVIVSRQLQGSSTIFHSSGLASPR